MLPCCCCCCCCCAAAAGLLLLRGERRRRGGPRRRARRCGLFRDPHKEEAPSVRLDLPPARVDRPGRGVPQTSPTAARAPAVRAPGRQPPRCRCSARRCRPAARHPVGGHVFEYFTTRKHALSRRTVSRVSPLSRACWVALTSGVWRPLSRRTVRLPHTRHGSRSPVITVAAAQRARGARDGGAEQRPLARCRCSVCQPETRALPLHARLLPCPVTRRALARPPHRARSARLLAAAAARPAPPRLPPLLTRTARADGAPGQTEQRPLRGRCQRSLLRPSVARAARALCRRCRRRRRRRSVLPSVCLMRVCGACARSVCTAGVPTPCPQSRVRRAPPPPPPPQPPLSPSGVSRVCCLVRAERICDIRSAPSVTTPRTGPCTFQTRDGGGGQGPHLHEQAFNVQVTMRITPEHHQ